MMAVSRMTQTVALPTPQACRGIDHIHAYLAASTTLLRGGSLNLTPVMGREVKAALRWMERVVEKGVDA